MKTAKIVALVGGAVVAAGVAAVGGAYWCFGHRMDDETAAVLAAKPGPETIVTEKMLAGLPEPAQRYLRYAGVVGHAIPRTVMLRQTGRIRGTDGKWMPLEADEYYSTMPPRLVWRAYLPKRSLPIVSGRDTYRDGKASILMKMLAIKPVADEHGAELGDAGLMRYLSEMVWFPAAFLGPNVKWTAVNATAVDVTITDSGHTATGRLIIDAQGRLTNFIARRFNTSTRKLTNWETPITGYGTFEGLRLPSRGSAVWKEPHSDFEYIQLEVTQIRYDPD